uniref:CYP450 n=1 Tax=Locusta migratoria TaxID=7004 RepID=A0A6F8GXK9_LOCMI|nr:CYP450 [Locusta migratoria]
MAVWLVLGAALASLCAGLFAVACWLWINRLQTSAPGPPPVPLLGNAQHFYRQPVMLDRIGQLHKQYGDVFRFYIGPKLVIVVTQPEDIKRVLLSSKAEKREPFITYAALMFLGKGLLTNDGEMWKRHRKMVEPAFHFSELERYLECFNQGGNLLNEKLTATGGAEIDVYSCICLCTVRCVMFALSGVDFNRLEPDPSKQEEYVTYISTGLKDVTVMVFRPWKRVPGFMWMFMEGRELKRLAKTCRQMFERFREILKDEINNTKTAETKILLNYVSEENTHQVVTDDEIRDEAMTLLITGSETTAACLSYTLALLGLYPEWQENAWRNLDQVFGVGGDYLRPVTTEDLSQLTVIDAIIKETLRLFSTVPLIPRRVEEDIPLAGGRYVAPRGSCVGLGLFLMHRHPGLFPDPDKFDPSRFLPGGSAASRRSFSYLPFGAGPRVCLGSNFAMMEMKIFLTSVLRRFRIIPGSSREELEDSLFCITSHPLTGFRVSFLPREMTACK